MMTNTLREFIERRETDWKTLETITNKLKGRRILNANEIHELNRLYRAVISDLALARRDYPNQRVTVFLNQLLTRAHAYIYQEDTRDLGRLLRYFTHHIPQTFRNSILFTFVAFLFLFVPAGIAFRAALVNPQSADMLGLQAQRRALANAQTWTDIPIELRPYSSAFIMGNNIRVAILAFGGGIAFGVFTIYVLVFNGLMLGAVLGLAVRYGMGVTLGKFIIGHGVVELSIIFIAGGAGLQLGWALLAPGEYSRRDALAQAARRAVPLVILAIPALICAGLIEGFISPANVPLWVNVAVGLGSGALLYCYLGLASKSEPGLLTTQPPEAD